jgi:hypothetical protein
VRARRFFAGVKELIDQILLAPDAPCKHIGHEVVGTLVPRGACEFGNIYAFFA